ncbi:26229_t:CDS:2 [Gigaspora rosea]|nr:26229_t:CDS:2 [Gigaspora rosea]
MKKKCNKVGLKWVEQILDYNVEKTLNWEEFHNNIQRIPRGIELKWYREICELLAVYENPTLKLQKPNPFTFNKVKKGVNTKWILTTKDEWGKVSSIKGYQMIVTHWIRTEKNLKKCKGCEKNSKSLMRKKCTMLINTQDTYIVQVDTKGKIHMRVEDITDNERIVIASQAFNGIKEESWIKWIDKNYIRKQITIEITAKKIKKTNKVEQMVAIAKLKHEKRIWKLEISTWPTQTHTMLTLVLLLLIIVNPRAKVEIISNDKPVLKLIEEGITKHVREKRNINNKEYASITECVKKLKIGHNITTKYEEEIKITGEEEINITTQLDPQYILWNQIIIMLDGYPIIYSVNQSLKHIFQAKNNIEWFNQRRIRALHCSRPSILWETTLKYISWGDAPLSWDNGL